MVLSRRKLEARALIRVSRLDGKEFVINALLIETIEAVPDTVISLTTGRKYVVRESMDELLVRITTFHQGIHNKSMDTV